MEITFEELRQLLNPQTAPVVLPNATAQFVIVRGRDSGVHVGTLAARAGQAVTLLHTSRIWRWRGANTLNELSLHGPHRTQHTRISERVATNTILDAVEVINCIAPEAAFAPVWND